MERIIDFVRFSQANWRRCRDAFKCADKPNLYWATALAEEVGEVAGIIKKLDRGFTERDRVKQEKAYLGYTQAIDPHDESLLSPEEFWFANKKQSLSKEMADVFSYLDLMATANGIDLPEAIINKFNEVSKAMNYEATS